MQIPGEKMMIDQDRPSIAHFVHRYLFLTGSWIYSQLRNMNKYRPFILTSELENLDLFPFDRVHCYKPPFKANKPWKLTLLEGYEAITHKRERYFRKVIKKRQAALLHAHFGTEGYYNLDTQEKTSLPLVTTFYGADVSKLPQSYPKWLKRYRKLFASGSLFLAEGPFMAQCIADLGCPSHKIQIQHLGVDLQRIKFYPRIRADREPVKILMACSFREKKGIPYGIEAFARACKKFPEMELRIIGGAKFHEEILLVEECKNLAIREGIANKVKFLGYIPYHQYLKESKSAHIFLSPSVKAKDGDTEGGAPVSVIEASASGMPIIATRHCDIPNVVLDRDSGILVPERNIEYLSEAILELATCQEIWYKMGKVGRKYVEKEFDVRCQISRLEKIYDKLIS